MSLLILLLQALGLIVLALIVISIALIVRKTASARAAKESNSAARIGVEAPTNYDETGR